MSTPVITDKWAGNYDCAICRRKRLVADEFSKKALERYRKTGGPLKCKHCVQQAEIQERQAAAAKAKSPDAPSSTSGTYNSTNIDDEKRTCVGCHQDLDASCYNRNQWNKGVGKSRCRECVEQSVKDDERQRSELQVRRVDEARQAVQQAQQSGDARVILQAESVLAALEAEKVTGLKPVRMGGRGRGIGRAGGGRGSNRGSR